MTALTGSHAPAGIFGSGGAQPQANPQLASGVGQQIQWMVGKSVSSASINVTPADLGPLKIHVQMQHDGGLQVQLMAHQHMTRDMLEQSLPRLRDWLQEAGLGQANVSVGPDTSGDTGAQLAQQQGQGSGHSSSAFGSGSGLSGLTDSGHEARVIQGPVTLLDLFA
jgi:flagellar hook-length control protein FliK